MQILTELTGLRGALGQWRQAGQSIAFVPTMGNLHAGHYSLIARARQLADRVVASVFVNPTQFGPNEDFSRYPRTPEQDAEGLADAGCDVLWLPDVGTMYPFGADGAVRMHVPGISDVLDGAARPGHFDGVTTVVTRLFLQVQPDFAVFGRKDYQQLAVIRHFVRDLAFPIEIIGADIRRDDDGLALSSRNQYLDADARARAPLLYRTLKSMRDRLLGGEARAGVEAAATAELEAAGFLPDYTVIRTPALAEPVDGQPGPRVALLAARIGSTRLIDNLEFDLP